MGKATRRLAPSGRKRVAIYLAVSAACVLAMVASNEAVATASPASTAGPASPVSPASTPGSLAGAQAAAPSAFWTSYLNGPLHSSYSPSQAAITPRNARTLVRKWSSTLGAPYISSPIVFRGSVYVGGGNGWFYRLSEHTGQVLAKVYLGSQPSLTCPYALGVSSTATLARDPRTHILTVYVSGGDGYLYALGAQTLARQWRSVLAVPSKTINDYYDWSSPEVVNGKIYIGIASSCDRPLVRGTLLAFSQTTGRRLAARYMVGPGSVGGTVWSTVAVAPTGDLFVTTGNGPLGRPLLGHSESILKLNPNTLAVLGSFQVPLKDIIGDGDFGASPVIFGSYVGACDKDGVFYALRQSTMKLVWRQRIGLQDKSDGSHGECIAAPVYDGRFLYFGGNVTTITGPTTLGSVQKRLATTGALIWATGLTGGVMGSPSMDGRGLLAVGAYSPGPTGVYLVSAATGSIVKQLTPDGAFAQTAFAENELFTATDSAVSAWGLPGT